MNELVQVHLLAGWGGMLMGALSGAIMGLLFHRENWAGGYASWPRRMIRLGHISFFGIGLLNLMYGLSLELIPLQGIYPHAASTGFITAAITMPMVCLLSAWRKPMRHLFFIPVTSVFLGIVPVVAGGILV